MWIVRKTSSKFHSSIKLCIALLYTWLYIQEPQLYSDFCTSYRHSTPRTEHMNVLLSSWKSNLITKMCRPGCNLNPFGVGWGGNGDPSRWSTYKLKLIPTRSHYCLLLGFFFTDSTCIDHESFCPDCPPCPRRSGPYFGGCGRPALASTHLGQYQSLFGVPELLFICRHCKWKGASHPSQTRTLFVSVTGSMQIVHPSEGFIYALAPLGKAGSTRSSFTMSFTAWANCWWVSCWSTAGWFIKPFAPRWRARAFGAWPPLMVTVVGASCTQLVGTASGLDGLVLPADFNFPAIVGVVDFLSVTTRPNKF